LWLGEEVGKKWKIAPLSNGGKKKRTGGEEEMGPSRRANVGSRRIAQRKKKKKKKRRSPRTEGGRGKKSGTAHKGKGMPDIGLIHLDVIRPSEAIERDRLTLKRKRKSECPPRRTRNEPGP